jgi:hypothetical protein
MGLDGEYLVYTLLYIYNKPLRTIVEGPKILSDGE